VQRNGLVASARRAYSLEYHRDLLIDNNLFAELLVSQRSVCTYDPAGRLYSYGTDDEHDNW
jgi:hypothetical protein